jgi:hypothetical protein
MDVAFDRLRRYARSNNQKLRDVARSLVERDLDPDLMLTATQPRLAARPRPPATPTR